MGDGNGGEVVVMPLFLSVNSDVAVRVESGVLKFVMIVFPRDTALGVVFPEVCSVHSCLCRGVERCDFDVRACVF